MTSSNKDRDFNDVGTLRFPGRFDPRLLQNIPDAGDGWPGLQAAIRNAHKPDMHPMVKEYYCSTDAELDAAVTDITNNNYAGRIIITEAISNVQVAINAPNSSFIIEGNGDTVVLDPDGNNRVFSITNCQSCVIRDLKIDFSDFTSSGIYAIFVNEASDNKVTIDNVTAIGDAVNGHAIRLNSDGCTVINCYLAAGNQGIYMAGSKYHRIIANEIFDFGTAGIRMDGGGCDFNLIEGNEIHGCTIGIDTDEADNNRISDNYIYGNATNGIKFSTNCYYNIISNNNIDNNILLTRVFYNTISGNYITGGIKLLATSGPWYSDYNLITGNIIPGGFAGIELDGNDGGECRYNTISGNLCTGASFAGIYLHDRCSYNVITGNNCYNNGSIGIDIEDEVHYTTVSGNNCSQNDISNALSIYGGIIVGIDSDRNVITGNNCHGNNNTGAGNSSGIAILDANCNENTVIGNNCSSNDVQLLDNGTNTLSTTPVGAGDPLNNL